MPATTDPTINAWRAAVATLGGRLVELEANPTTALARAGGLTGETAAAWNGADAAVALAWETYRATDALLDEVDRDPDRAGVLLTGSTVPSPSGPADPTTAMRTAKDAVDAAVAVVERLAAAWDATTSRVVVARSAAEVGGDQVAVRAADALVDLLRTDPFAVHEADVTAIEAMAGQAQARRSAAELATARLDLDLAHARTTLDGLRAAVAAADAELDHAVARIAGLVRTQPVRDLDALGAQLDEIVALAPANGARAASALQDWQRSAVARQAELDAALAPARDGLRRREEARGLWDALRVKAAARRVDERADVAAALSAAKDALWEAPCDLAVAEAAMARLVALLQQVER